MDLKKATGFALVGISFELFIELLQWSISTFELISYEHQWIYRSLWLLGTLLRTIPILVFLTVLQKRQKGNSNG